MYETIVPRIVPRGFLPLAVLLLGGCQELGLKREAPREEFIADSVADTAPAPAPRATASRTRERGSYPSAEDVMYGPRPPRDTAPAAQQSPAVQRSRLWGEMKADLERLVRAQEQHLANTGEYATRFQVLGLRYVPHAGVDVSIVSATDTGWVGRAVRSGWEGRSCVVWVGRPESRPATDRQGTVPSRSGVPACDSL